MEAYRLRDYHRGWITGFFKDSIYEDDFEVAIQRYAKGQRHDKHYHKIATEINIITSGECCFEFYTLEDNKKKEIVIACQDDIIVIRPNEVCRFTATTDCCLTVIKTHSRENDKYVIK